jgi:multiple sugar transport system permease protein
MSGLRSVLAAAVGRIRSRPSALVLAVVLAFLALPLLFPLWWMVSVSFMGPGEVFAYPPKLIPESFRFENYLRAFELQPFARQYANSLYIAVINVAGTLVFASAAGYAFARIRFPGRNLLFLIFLSALLMPIEVLVVPLYILMRDLGWLGTHLPLIVLPIFGIESVVGVFIMRQFFLSLPHELEDAGRIDGLTPLGVFWRIALPLARPALAAVAILTFLTSWNAFLEPLIFASGSPDVRTIPVAIPLFADQYGKPIWEVQMAASTLSVVPILIVFILAQRHFIRGIARVGIQG